MNQDEQFGWSKPKMTFPSGQEDKIMQKSWAQLESCHLTFIALWVMLNHTNFRSYAWMLMFVKDTKPNTSEDLATTPLSNHDWFLGKSRGFTQDHRQKHQRRRHCLVNGKHRWFPWPSMSIRILTIVRGFLRSIHPGRNQKLNPCQSQKSNSCCFTDTAPYCDRFCKRHTKWETDYFIPN